METQFVNLHVHTAYGSLLDSVSKPEDVIKKIKVMQQPAIACTEHGTVFSSVKMYKLAQQNDVKFLYGCEFYITDDRFIKDKNNKYYHLTVLAKNEQGRININKLVSESYRKDCYYYKPRIDFGLLSQHSEGLIVLSGCMASNVQQALAGGKIGEDDIEITRENYLKAKDVAQMYRSVFGGDYYLEVQSHSDHRQQKLNRAIVDIAKELGYEWVATSDSHFVDESDFELHSIFVQIGQTREAGEVYRDTQLQSVDDVRKLLKPALTDEEIDVAINTTMKIVDKCNVDLPLSAPIMPHINIPNGFDSEDDYLKHLCNLGWKERGFDKLPKEQQKIYRDRLYYEYNAIKKMGFIGYYLLVGGYANSVYRRAPARGSGGGSLIAYLLDIIGIDPIEYGLYFERFIDVSALDLLEQGIITEKELKVPDFDLDFAPNDRDVVLKSIVEEYGQDRVAALGSFMYIWDKSAIKDVGRVLGVPFDVTNAITKLMDKNTTLDEIEKSHANIKAKYPKLFEYAKKLTGLPKSSSVHPSGKVIMVDDVNYYTATSESDNGEQVLHLDMDDAGELGLVKVDILGLRTIQVIYDTLELLGKGKDYINPKNLDFKDPKVLDVFQRGETFSIFQFESHGMQRTLQEMIPSGLEDLGAANALFRPGSMNYISNFIHRKHGEEEFEYLHPDLEPILRDTYGIIVFQEQLIEIGRLAGMRNPDLLRQATGKKDVKKLEKAKPELFDGLTKRDWNETQLNRLWEDMLAFAQYSFNRSHSFAYAIIAFQTAKLMIYHPLEYMVSLINAVVEHRANEKIPATLSECKKKNIEILIPDINKSQSKFVIQDGKIRFGLTGIRGVGESVAEEIIEERNNNGDFKDFTDFKSRTNVDKGATIALIYAGCFGQNKDELLLQYAESMFERKLYKPVKGLPTKAILMENDIIRTDDEFKNKELCLERWNDYKKTIHDASQQEKYETHIQEFEEKYLGINEMYEFDSLSVFLTKNPLDGYEQFFKPITEAEDGHQFLIGGTISKTSYKTMKGRGKKCEIKVLTQFGITDVVAYQKQIDMYKDEFKKGNTLVFLTNVKNTQFVVSRLKTFDQWKQERTSITKENSL